MLSARNQIPAQIVSITLGTIMAEIIMVDASGMKLVSVITKQSAVALGLKEGMRVKAIIKATEVMIDTDQKG